MDALIRSCGFMVALQRIVDFSPQSMESCQEVFWQRADGNFTKIAVSDTHRGLEERKGWKEITIPDVSSFL